ncbi:RHS repeat-associated core domain-containing protein [Pantoea sp. Tr-811]|uniref:RHS repeat-associated core domain-containing protein n=1 Tax=Pantoea sp. Tr-811 TaxID=2608361 RepID=UPI001424045D|nr:RHS repeat-associated core domain-containing protein [Pantoea sp. Tr-811]NIF27337.1 RHS repeat-associated core domain-containing protein [Pantoea sp. Tr-811]
MNNAIAVSIFAPYGHSQINKSLLGFNGEFQDTVSRLYALGNGTRAFNPALMRFLNPDRYSPFREGGLNAYAYCLGDPINFTDPKGSSPFFKGITKTLTNIFIPGDVPTEQFSPTRKRLHHNVDTSSLWGQATASINKALGSNGDNSIPEWKADSYIQRSWNASTSPNRLKKQSLSEPTLFFGSAFEWGEVAAQAWKQGQPEAAGAAAVGLAFNSAGGLMVGATVHSGYKTGRVLSVPANQQSNIRK